MNKLVEMDGKSKTDKCALDAFLLLILCDISFPEILIYDVAFSKVFILRELPFLLFLCSILAF